MYQHLLAKSKEPMTMTNQLCPHYCGVHCVRQMHFPIYVQLHVIVSGRIEKSDWGSSWWTLFFCIIWKKEACFINFEGSGTFHMSTEMTRYYPSLAPAILLCCYTAILHHYVTLCTILYYLSTPFPLPWSFVFSEDHSAWLESFFANIWKLY